MTTLVIVKGVIPIAKPRSNVTIKNEHQMAATDTPLAGKVAMRFFFSLMEKWGCSEDEQKVLLGGIGNDAYHKYKSSPEICLCHDLMERISYLMGIHRSLRVIFSNHADYGYHWVRKPNKTPPFNGQSALQLMLSGRTAELAEVRRYLDSVREPPF